MGPSKMGDNSLFLAGYVHGGGLDGRVSLSVGRVLEKGAPLLGLPLLPHEGEIRWSKRRIKGWFAKADYDHSTTNGSGLIRVNKVLDSADVSLDTLEFILWHEYLHLYLKTGHPKHFRELERKWPSCNESTRFLFNLNERFNVSFGL